MSSIVYAQWWHWHDDTDLISPVTVIYTLRKHSKGCHIVPLQRSPARFSAQCMSLTLSCLSLELDRERVQNVTKTKWQTGTISPGLHAPSTLIREHSTISPFFPNQISNMEYLMMASATWGPLMSFKGHYSFFLSQYSSGSCCFSALQCLCGAMWDRLPFYYLILSVPFCYITFCTCHCEYNYRCKIAT